MPRNSPRILRIDPQPLHALREASVTGGLGSSPTGKVRCKLCSICHVVHRVLREGVQRLLISRKRAAEHRFVNEVHAKPERMISGSVADIVTKLIFFLIAQ